jgi:hypothetical protein
VSSPDGHNRRKYREVLNVHERELKADPVRIGALIDSLASHEDLLETASGLLFQLTGKQFSSLKAWEAWWAHVPEMYTPKQFTVTTDILYEQGDQKLCKELGPLD